MCHFRLIDTIIFLFGGILFWISILIGIIEGYSQTRIPLYGFILFFICYVLYLVFFFEMWENKILCSHCPYYAFQEERRLHCYANAGIYKLWPYNPAPMNKSEQLQFLIGFGLFYIIPAIFLLWAKSYVALAFSSVLIILWIVIMQLTSCKKCPNFSCPLNRVSKDVIDEYLRRNPVMGKAWKDSGYELDKKKM